MKYYFLIPEVWEELVMVQTLLVNGGMAVGNHRRVELLYAKLVIQRVAEVMGRYEGMDEEHAVHLLSVVDRIRVAHYECDGFIEDVTTPPEKRRHILNPPSPKVRTRRTREAVEVAFSDLTTALGAEHRETAEMGAILAQCREVDAEAQADNRGEPILDRIMAISARLHEVERGMVRPPYHEDIM